MNSISEFDLNVYSEELYPVSESEFDEVMTECVADFEGYAEWSASLESAVVAESENFVALSDGRCYHKPEPKSNGRVGGIEI